MEGDNLGNTNTPKQTSTNANKVPILVKSVILEMDINMEGTPTKIPVMMVAKPGVPYLGCTAENFLGSNPSLLILIQILGCPN